MRSCCFASIAFCCFYSFCVRAESADFFNDRYRGWLWFEEGNNKLKKQLNEKENQDHSANNITPEEAKEELDKFARQLDDAKYVMLARPTASNIKAYMEKEAIAWKNIERLQKAWEVASFLYPEYHDLIKDPVNVHAVKLKREIDELEQQEVIKAFSNDFDLVLFFKGSCKLSTAFEPVLKNFAGTFGFKVEAITMDGTKSRNFVTADMPRLAQQLGIEAAPLLVAVSKDGKIAFELARGFVSLTELEQHSVRATKYLISKGILQKSSDEKTRKRLGKFDLLPRNKIKKLRR
jgi:conjugal transfer pilus assembly protein TraF